MAVDMRDSLTVTFIKVNIMRVNRMVKVYLHGNMEKFMMENGQME
jgi:hypothetical protein